MLYQKNFSETFMEREGFGGRITIATSLTDSKRYVIKLQRQKQSLNEYVAQKLIEALGYCSIPVDWYQDRRGYVYGALQFMDGLKPVGIQYCQGLTAEQKKKMLFHLGLSWILGNADGGEAFLMDTGAEDGSADICSLDYGEALCGKSIFAATFEEDVAGRLEVITKVSLKYMENAEDFGKIEIEDGCLETVRRLAELDMSKMASCLSDVEKYFGKQQSEWYQEYLEGLKAACAAVIKH